MTCTSLSPLPQTADGFRALTRRVLHATAPPTGAHRGPSDFDLNPEFAREVENGAVLAPGATPAAVLVPIVPRAEITLLLTQRTDHLAAHAGQIAFPGGKMEKGDQGPVATALREAQEEIGLDPHLVEPLGFLDSYRTGTGFLITPVVGMVDPGFTLALNRNEVADAFEVPLSFLMDPGNHHIQVRTFGERERRFYAMPYGDRFIWGATAGMLRNMHERFSS